MSITAPQYVYHCAKSPDVDLVENANCVCATCAAEIPMGVPISKIENPTFSQNADFLRYSKHVCVACAWLYWAGKGKPGNFIAAGSSYAQLVISHESVVENKEPWFKALNRIADMPTDTLACGVLTTDVKPRLWPRTKLATVGNFGLYVHAQDYDLSAYVEFDLFECLRISELIRAPLISGYSLSQPDHCVSVSWGKDSVVMLHLAASLLGSVHAVHGRYKTECERFEDMDTVSYEVLKQFNNIYYSEALVTGNWQMYERAGRFFLEPETPQENQAHTWYRKQWSEDISKLTGDKVMIGMRPDESRIRRMLVARFGASYITKAGRSTVLPLTGWSGQDVWAYLVANDLPWLKIYDVSRSREKARSDFAFGEKGVSHALMMQGQWLEWRDAYPNHFNKWVSRWPDMGKTCSYL